MSADCSLLLCTCVTCQRHVYNVACWCFGLVAPRVVHLHARAPNLDNLSTRARFSGVVHVFRSHTPTIERTYFLWHEVRRLLSFRPSLAEVPAAVLIHLQLEGGVRDGRIPAGFAARKSAELFLNVFRHDHCSCVYVSTRDKAGVKEDVRIYVCVSAGAFSASVDGAHRVCVCMYEGSTGVP